VKNCKFFSFCCFNLCIKLVGFRLKELDFTLADFRLEEIDLILGRFRLGVKNVNTQVLGFLLEVKVRVYVFILLRFD
jgi:hypothetical protein